MWKIKQGPKATYGNLLELCVKAGHMQCAEAVCEVLRKKCKAHFYTTQYTKLLIILPAPKSILWLQSLLLVLIICLQGCGAITMCCD